MHSQTKFALAAFTSLALAAACGVAPSGASTAENTDDNDAEMVAPVVLNIGIDQLHVARITFDLDTTIVRFTDPAGTLPLDRVQVLANGFAPEDLDDVVARCAELEGYEITGGDDFVVGQGESLLGDDVGASGQCVVCGFAVICPGTCRELGPGEVPHDASSFDDDPHHIDEVVSGDGNGGDTGTDGGGGSGGDSGGGSGGSSGSSGDSGSGASSGGTGGSHGGVGNPGA